MSDLSLFEKSIDDLLIRNPDWKLKVSGVARLEDIAGSINYSASFVPPVPDYQPPSDFEQRFRSAVVEGFDYVGIQSLSFLSSLPIPLLTPVVTC